MPGERRRRIQAVACQNDNMCIWNFIIIACIIYNITSFSLEKFEFSDAAIRQVEQKMDMDIDELKLNLKLPKEERESNL